ncbi:MAG: hypothetical protein GXO47_02640 [Chlorobi bacterium]|nr:hypothetical protein [Chlorobiota bacterium]
MKKQDKLRIIKDYAKLSDELKEQIKLAYPEGYSQHLIEFTNAKGELVSALPFELPDRIYLIKMSVKTANQIILDDDDYDEEGFLKDDSRKRFEDKQTDLGELPEMGEDF